MPPTIYLFHHNNRPAWDNLMNMSSLLFPLHGSLRAIIYHPSFGQIRLHTARWTQAQQSFVYLLVQLEIIREVDITPNHVPQWPRQEPPDDDDHMVPYLGERVYNY